MFAEGIMAEPFKGGQEPTLFPMMKAGSEDAATSIFFAVIGLVHPYRDRLLRSVGKSAYKNGNDYTCVLRPSIGGRLSDKDIPDAKIILDQKTRWEALVEVKIGSADLDQPQLGRYLNRAIEQKVDALITVSNEMCADPAMPPLRLKPAEKRLRKIDHFHWSWRYLTHQAQEVLQDETLDPVESAILIQFIDFLQHGASKVNGYHAMPTCWPQFVDTVRDKGTPSNDDIDDVIAGWFQESADLSMILTEALDVNVSQVIESPSAELRKEEAENRFEKDRDLSARFALPNKSYLQVDLDIDGRCFRFETAHKPTDRVKTSSKQVEHFLKMFVSSDNPDEWGDHSDVRLFARWARKRTLTDIPMSDALLNLHDGTLKDIEFVDSDRDLRELIIRYTPTGASSAIKSRKKSIEFLESQALYFAETYVDMSD
ncbi:hypothetical protein GCM10007853_19240 [Algimonas ampicilliniresistens]|uniref:PD-(D/E)XK nuclease superfamily protein n=2 Tax=Algimonas ampicilliniresistens TaxID=1298735 RepID=A0ABQ5VBI9_9PROT|nr:hypothetical protein GCM10007853_19240 [Algimonas ampicilliniresistens]